MLIFLHLAQTIYMQMKVGPSRRTSEAAITTRTRRIRRAARVRAKTKTRRMVIKRTRKTKIKERGRTSPTARRPVERKTREKTKDNSNAPKFYFA